MKTFKRALSSFLAMLMIFSTFSASITSLAAEQTDGKSVEVYTDFYVQDAEGNWDKTDKVKAGDKVEARVSLKTNYYVGGSTLFWIYDKEFMTIDTTGWDLKDAAATGNSYNAVESGVYNTDTNSIPVKNGWKGFFVHSDECIEFSYADNLAFDEVIGGSYEAGLEFFEDKGYIVFFLTGTTPAICDTSDYIFKFTFTVKNPPANGKTEGYFKMLEEAYADPAKGRTGEFTVGGIHRAESATSFDVKTDEQSYKMHYDLALNDANTIKLYTETSTTYTQNVYTMDTTGKYSTTAVTTNPVAEIGSTIKASEYSAPDGFSVDTTMSSADVTAVAGGSSVMNVYLKRNQYKVTFDGKETEQYYDAVIVPETAEEKLGYTFAGWYAGETMLTETTKVPVGGAAYTARYTPNEVGYTVNKYFMNTDGETYADPVAEAFPKAKTGDEVSYSTEFEGFILDKTQGTLSGTVKGDGTLVLEAYYTRKKVQVTINGETEEMYYGETIDKPADPPADPGYKFDQWVDGEGDPIAKWPVVVGEDPIVIEPSFSKLPRTVTYKYVGAPSGYDVPAPKIAYIEDVIELPTLPTVEGYTISDWVITDANGDTITDGKVGTTDVTVTATWTLNAYKVTLDLDGGEAAISSITKKHGEALHADELPDVVKAGYDHLGWTVDGADATFPMTINGVVTLKAKLVAHNYNITYVFSGANKPADVAVPPATTGVMGSAIPMPVITNPEGYTFGGWVATDADGFEITDGLVGTSDITVTGKWTINLHDVTFATGIDGTTIAALKNRPYGAEITAPSTDISALKPGYTFGGWKDVATGNVVTFPFSMPDRNVELEAVWTKTPRTITYVYVGAPEGYDVPPATTGVIGDTIALPKLPTVDGYAVGNWVITDANGNAITDGLVGLTDVTVTSTWTKNAYVVTFWLDEDGTKVHHTENYTYGQALAYPDEPNVPGYIFEGWSEVEGMEVTEALDVYPVYTAIEYNVTVLGLYSDVVDEWIGYYGDEITLADLLTKEDMDQMLADNGDFYTFDFWEYDGDEITADTVITVTEDVTIEGNFTAMEAKLIFDAKGAIFAESGSGIYEVELLYDDTITANMYPAIPEYEGHTFGAWSLNLIGEPMDSLEKTVYIHWTKNTYKVKFVNGLTGEEIKTVEGKYGDPVEAPALPTVAGYTFAWDNTVTSIPAKNEKGEVMAAGGTMTVTAVPTAKTYAVNYYVDGEIYNTLTVAYGKPVEAIAAPAAGDLPSGYSFLGWSLDETATLPGNLGVVGDGDVNVYAVLQASGDVAYKVEIYQQKLEGGYELVDTDEFTNGTTGKVAPYAVDQNVEGFVFNEGASVLDTPVAGDGSTVLKVYYDRKTITVDINGKEDDVPFGTEIDLPNDVDDNDPGTEFDKWVDEDGNEVSDPYIVPDSEDGTPVVITPVFTNKEFTITYYRDGASVYSQRVAYKADVELAYGDSYMPDGYVFIGWTLTEGSDEIATIDTMPAHDVDLYAIYEADTIIEYTVEFYKQNLEGGYEPAGTETYQNGTTGEEAPYVVDKDKFEGFVFNADASILDTPVAGDGTTVLEVYYDRKTIKVVINGEEQDVPFGTEIDLPNDVDDKDPGTEFDKWVDEDGKEVSDPYVVPDSEDGTPVVITPVYKNNSFEVTFVDELNGTTKTNSYEYTTKIPNPGSPSAVGYEFNGWFTKDGDKYVAGTTTVPNANVTYYAKYTGLDVTYIVNVYFEKLDGKGWEDVKSTVVDGVAGETAKYTETFEGFTLDKDISTTESVIKGDSSTVLVIYFTRNDVTINVDGEEKDVPYGTEVDKDDLKPDVEPGYKVDKWVDGEGNEITFPVEIKGGEEFIPVIVKDSYSLIFRLADGTVVEETAAVEFDSEITAPQAPEAAEGYTFAGWVDAATNEPFNGKMPAKATVYVAVYTNNEAANYTVNIYIMNTEGVEELSGSYTATAAIGTTQSVVPGKVEFCTLDTAKSNTSCVVLADGTASINLYFVRGLYTVSFDGVETQVYAGAVIPVPADPAVEGKKFLGWTPAIPNVMPENDLEFTSTWEDVTYTITYVVNGDKIVHNYKFGDNVTAYEVTEAPAGLTFKGWSDTIPATMPAENITVSAIFEAAAYTVTYLDAEGNVFVSYSVAFGAAIPVPADAPAKEFYTFKGWSAAPATMPAENITIEPIFEPVPVRLIAAPGSTTVIDRDNMVIYGLDIGLSAKILDDNFLDYEGDGTLVIKPVTEGTSRYGTGAVVELYDNADGSLVEAFHIVVFGDLNGDSHVNGLDISIASDEAFWITDWSLEGENFEVYKLIAADLDHNGFIDTTDVSNIKNYVLSLVEIDQVAGKIVRS